MAIITDVRFAHERGALAETLEALPETELTVVRETGTDPEHSRYLIRFEGAPPTVRRVLDRDRTVRDAEQIPGDVRPRLWGVEFAPEAKLLNPRVTSEGGFVLDARSARPEGGRRGWYERWLLPGREALRDVWEYARAEEFDFEIVNLRQQGGPDPDAPDPGALTDQQREALVAAYENGYFQVPRSVSMDDLASEFGISDSALSQRIRRGTAALIAETIASDF